MGIIKRVYKSDPEYNKINGEIYIDKNTGELYKSITLKGTPKELDKFYCPQCNCNIFKEETAIQFIYVKGEWVKYTASKTKYICIFCRTELYPKVLLSELG